MPCPASHNGSRVRPTSSLIFIALVFLLSPLSLVFRVQRRPLTFNRNPRKLIVLRVVHAGAILAPRRVFFRLTGAR